MQKFPMTEEGFRALKGEIARLQNEERPKVIQAIEEARAHGDLSENAEYHAAKESQRLLEHRIAEIDEKIHHAEVIRPETLSGDNVKFGAKVTIRDEASGKEITYQIVGVDEADVDKGQISLEAPVAKALLGQSKGDKVEVATPNGGRAYTITDITYR